MELEFLDSPTKDHDHSDFTLLALELGGLNAEEASEKPSPIWPGSPTMVRSETPPNKQ